jgi:hypothetical protein
MPSWDELLKEGDQLFDYLCRHFYNLFDHNNNILFFDMWPATNIMHGYYEKINKEYGKSIHDTIVPWIHEEYKSGRLTNKEHWKPFRIPYQYTLMVYGYRKLFMFDKYYFQLILSNDRDMIDEVFTHYVCFQVALYGWKSDGSEALDRSTHVPVSDDMLMPEKDWKRRT